MSKLQEAILYYAEHPYEFVCDTIDFTGLTDAEGNDIIAPTEQQKQALDKLPIAIKENKGIAIKSGHGTGKTAFECWAVIWFMSTRPNPKIPCTAPTQEGLYDVFWSELSKWHDRFKWKDTFNWTKTKYQHKQLPEKWFATARTSNKPENMQGFHAPHLLFIVDEASGVDSEILEAIEGSQTQSGSLIIYLGNPTQISGGLWDAFHSKRKFFYLFTFNSEDSVMVKKSYCEKIAAKYGKDSDIYRVRVLGEFPKAEPDTCISLDRVEKAVANSIDIDLSLFEVVEFGVDCARFGDDESSCYRRIGNKIVCEFIFSKNDIPTLANEVYHAAKKWHKIKHVVINIDDTGLGGGVTDILNQYVEEGSLFAEINGVNNNNKACDEDMYANVGTELWFHMNNRILELDIPNDTDLIGQLSGRKRKFIGKKNALEKKEDMKKRGLVSPDRADGCILTLYSELGLIRDRADDIWGVG